MSSLCDRPEFAAGTAALGFRMHDVEKALAAAQELKDVVDRQVTPGRVLRYLKCLCATSAPSSVASLCRGQVLRDLWAEDGAIEGAGARFDGNASGTGNAVLTLGGRESSRLWYVAHLDTISYLVRPEIAGRNPLVPFCVHLTRNGERSAFALRYDLTSGKMEVCAVGRLVSEDGQPFFVMDTGDRPRPGDRVVPSVEFDMTDDGVVTGNLDNAGGVAALAVAATVLAELGTHATIAFPDEEEGPLAIGNQSIARGSARLASRIASPDLAIVVDCQQTPGIEAGAAASGSLGHGAVLNEFSSLGRGSVTPPPLYAASRKFMDGLEDLGVVVGEPPNSYTSRSDDVSMMLRTQNVLLLGFPAKNRHFDEAAPTAHLSDILHLAKSLVYASVLALMVREHADG